jgi:DNA-binding MarR family transcriptional regulator
MFYFQKEKFNMSFLKFYSSFEQTELSPAAMLVLANLYDRMELSRKNKGFYDTKLHKYYVTFTRAELSAKIHVGVETITRIFKTLVAEGWIMIKHRFNASNRIFLLISLESKNATSKIPNLDSNQTELNQTNTTRDTNVTEKGEKPVPAHGQSDHDQSVVVEEAHQPIVITAKDAIASIVKGVQDKIGVNTDQLLNTMLKYTRSHKELEKVLGIIFKAKHAVKQALQSHHNDVKAALTFESNDDLMPRLTATMQQLFLKTHLDTSIQSRDGYLYTALFNFFHTCVLNYNHGEVPNIPIFKLC